MDSTHPLHVLVYTSTLGMTTIVGCRWTCVLHAHGGKELCQAGFRRRMLEPAAYAVALSHRSTHGGTKTACTPSAQPVNTFTEPIHTDKM